MDEIIIVGMRSITYAMKAQDLLRSKGIGCEIVRKTKGCGYALRVKAGADRTRELLRGAGLPYGEITGGES